MLNFSADPGDAVPIGKEIRSLWIERVSDSILSEWHLSADFTEEERKVLRGADNAALAGDVMVDLHDSAIGRAEFYRGDAAWMGLFDLQAKLFKTAYRSRPQLLC
jgi:hypothetical protein